MGLQTGLKIVAGFSQGSEVSAQYKPEISNAGFIR